MSAIVWWEVETRLPERFMRFHSALSGWAFEPAFANTDLGADYWLITHDGESVGGLQRSTASASPPTAGVRVYLDVPDLELALRRAVELGGTIERSRTALGGDDRWFGVFTDPAGVSFGAWTRHAADPRSRPALSEERSTSGEGHTEPGAPPPEDLPRRRV